MTNHALHDVADLPSLRLHGEASADPAGKWPAFFRGLALAGAVTAIAGAAIGGALFWAALLLVSVFLVGLGLAGAVLMAIEYVTGAGWSVAWRRVPEAMTAFLPWGALGVGAVLVFHPALYPWAGGEHGPHASAFKALWLSRPFFLARAAVYAAIWIGFARAMVRNSRRQDEGGGARLRKRNTAIGAAFLVSFALTCWLASVDWLMSLEPEWYSTIYGVYFFSGLMTSGLAAVVLLGLWMGRTGQWRGPLNEEHLHDLGKLLLTFCTFWAYIWFSQYMLIWYANIPEETAHYVRRVSGAWGSLMIVNILLNWAIPFFVLLSRKHKRDARIMAQIAGVVLLGRWLDLYLLIVPAVPGAQPLPGLWMAGLTLGLIGAAGAIFRRAMRQAPPVPVGDPYLAESLRYHQ